MADNNWQVDTCVRGLAVGAKKVLRWQNNELWDGLGKGPNFSCIFLSLRLFGGVYNIIKDEVYESIAVTYFTFHNRPFPEYMRVNQ